MRAPPKRTMVEFDPVLRHQKLGLQKLELKPHRAQLVAHEEIGVREGQPICRRPPLRAVRDLPRGFDVFVRVAQRLLPVVVHVLSSGVDCTQGFPAL